MLLLLLLLLRVGEGWRGIFTLAITAMADPTYIASRGLELISIDDRRLACSLYGRQYTIVDETGLIRSLLTRARVRVARHELVEEHLRAFPADVIDAAIGSLIAAQFLLEQHVNAPAGDIAQSVMHLTSNTWLNAEAALARNRAPIRVVGSGHVATHLSGALSSMALPHVVHAGMKSCQSTDTSLIIACSDRCNHGQFREINALALAAGQPVLYVALDWHVAVCGPLVIPGATACYECYYHRVRSTRRHYDEFVAREQASSVLVLAEPNRVAAHWAASLAISHALGYLADASGEMHLCPIREADVLHATVERSWLLKLPRCAACGRANGTAPKRSPVRDAAGVA